VGRKRRAPVFAEASTGKPSRFVGWHGAFLQSRLQNRLAERKFLRWGGSGSRQFDEAFQLPNAGGVAHFPEGLGFDLADPLAGDLELAADFLKRAAVAVLEAESLFEDLALAFG
jgi:hypothetical protein